MTSIKRHFDGISGKYDYYKKKNYYYYDNIKHSLKSIIKPESTILEVGTGTGEIINFLNPAKGIGIDISDQMIRISREKYINKRNLKFLVKNLENSPMGGKFKYVLLIDVIEHLKNPLHLLRNIKRNMDDDSFLIISMINPLWEPILMILEKLNMKMPEGPHKRMTIRHFKGMLNKEGFKLIKSLDRILIPSKIPIISDFVNNNFFKIPLIKRLSLVKIFIIRLSEDN